MKEILITNATVSQDIIGGASKAIDDIADQLAKDQYRVFIFAPNRSGSKRPCFEIISPNISIIRYKYFQKFRILNPIFAIATYLKFFGLKRFDLVWGNSPEPWIYIPKNGKKKIYSVHGPWKTESNLDKSNKNRLRELSINLAYRFILKKDVLYHFQSDYVFNSCIKEEARFQKFKKIIIPVLLDEKKLLKKRSKSFKSHSKKINILVARRLVNRTGVREFLRLTDGLDEFLDITIIGDGYLSDSIKELSRYRPNVRFLGKVEDDILYEEITKCDLVCMPSIDAEGFGASILQALFLFKPVLYTKVGGMNEFLQHNTDCFPFDLYQKNEFECLIKKLLNLKIERRLTVNLSAIDYSFSNNLEKILNA